MSTELEERIQFFLSRQVAGRSTQVAPGLCVGSLKGPVRTDNQDRAAVAHITRQSGENYIISLICDGMGGMAEGGAAAGWAAATFLARFSSARRGPIRTHIVDAVLAANAEVYRRFKGSGGTTLTALIVLPSGEAWAAHVGDSRLYAKSDQIGLQVLTRDDTIGGQLARSSGANEDTLDNRLLQFVGIGTSIEPHVFPVNNTYGTLFLLTSDGAHSIGKRAIEDISRNSGGPGDLVRKITYVAEAVGVEDNSSAVSVNFAEFDPLPRFTGGVELTIWSPSERLELWLGPPPPLANRDQPVSAGQSAEVTPQKPKKAPRSRAKKPASEEAIGKRDPDKPQLNIEFGSRDKKSQ